MSCALKRVEYNVVAIDVEPEPYLSIAEGCGVDVVKCDLERDELKVANADCAIFTEVLEHLHYYYVPSVLEKINRVEERRIFDTNDTKHSLAFQETEVAPW
jgi:hypothetical protein